ncbi:MAG: branched-chain amino acid ABC transporter permease [Chloroflexaceae bacterium]|nr:branched-chain amino acid ABC transporter permease [Chloroflexaceae bacterium]
MDGSDFDPGEIDFEPNRPEPSDPNEPAPYNGSDPIVLEAQSSFPTGIDLHQKIIWRTCTPNGGVCHNSKEFPDLRTPANFVAAFGLNCNVQYGEYQSVYDRCERPGDRFRLEGGAFGFDFNRAQISQLHFYVMVLAVLAIMLLVVNRLNNSRIGRAWTAIREDETAAIAMGVPLVQMKLLAFVTGASFAGVMGMIFAAKLTFINPPTFDLIRSINILAMVILGGMGSIPGALLGATLVTLLNLQLLPRITAELEARVEGLPAALDPAQYQRMIFGLLLVLMTIFRPQGLLPEERRSGELHSDNAPILTQEGPEPVATADKPTTEDSDSTVKQAGG